MVPGLPEQQWSPQRNIYCGAGAYVFLLAQSFCEVSEKFASQKLFCNSSLPSLVTKSQLSVKVSNKAWHLSSFTQAGSPEESMGHCDAFPADAI